MRPHKERGPLAGGPLGGCQTTDQSNQASKIVGLPRYERKSDGASADFILLSEVTGDPGAMQEIAGLVWCGFLPAWHRLPNGRLGWDRQQLRERFQAMGVYQAPDGRVVCPWEVGQ